MKIYNTVLVLHTGIIYKSIVYTICIHRFSTTECFGTFGLMDRLDPPYFGYRGTNFHHLNMMVFSKIGSVCNAVMLATETYGRKFNITQSTVAGKYVTALNATSEVFLSINKPAAQISNSCPVDIEVSGSVLEFKCCPFVQWLKAPLDPTRSVAKSVKLKGTTSLLCKSMERLLTIVELSEGKVDMTRFLITRKRNRHYYQFPLSISILENTKLLTIMLPLISECVDFSLAFTVQYRGEPVPTYTKYVFESIDGCTARRRAYIAIKSQNVCENWTMFQITEVHPDGNVVYHQIPSRSSKASVDLNVYDRLYLLINLQPLTFCDRVTKYYFSFSHKREDCRPQDDSLSFVSYEKPRYGVELERLIYIN